MYSIIGIYRQFTDPAQVARTVVDVKPVTGNYRVTLLGVKAIKETADDPMQWDGKRDEIYAAVYWAKMPFNSNPAVQSGYHKTLIHGDVNNLPGRIPAGTASPQGGIKTGDQVPANLVTTATPGIGVNTDRFPLVLWEGTLSDSSESVIIAPVVFESDRKESPAWQSFTGWWTTPEGRGELIDAAAKGRAKASLGWIRIGRVDDNGFEYGPRFDVNNGNDRPIGVKRTDTNVSTGWWVPQGYVLTRELVEKALGASQAVVIEQNNWDALFLDGNYTMYLQVERR
jgi:hypothetical protein